MSIILPIELGVEIPLGRTYIDLHEKATAACNTADLLNIKQAENPTQKEATLAKSIVEEYVVSPERVSKDMVASRLAALPSASLRLTKQLLDEFSRSVVESAVEIRNLVVNKLILETSNSNPTTRIRALELLGKITEVGLFTERKEVTVTHKSSDEVQLKLKEKLEKLRQRYESSGDIEDVQYEEEVEPDALEAANAN